MFGLEVLLIYGRRGMGFRFFENCCICVWDQVGLVVSDDLWRMFIITCKRALIYLISGSG